MDETSTLTHICVMLIAAVYCIILWLSLTCQPKPSSGLTLPTVWGGGGGGGGHKMWFVDDLPLGKRLELSKTHTLRAQLHLHGVYIDLRARIVLVAVAAAIGDNLFLLTVE